MEVDAGIKYLFKTDNVCCRYMRSGVEIMEVMTDRKSGIFNYTVGELIEVLKEYPKDMPVIVSGYESGYENFYLPIVQKVRRIP